MRATAFGAPRERPAPPTWTFRDHAGVIVEMTPQTTTIVVAVKENCDGCRSFYCEPRDDFGATPVVVVARTASDHFVGGSRDVLVSPELLDALEIRSAPFYVVVAPSPPRVVLEGIAFDPGQVARECAAHLS